MSENEQSTWANPHGIDGFACVEFADQALDRLGSLFEQLGFTHTATHQAQAIALYQQGDIVFLLNAEPHGRAADFYQAHGPSACAFGLQVANAAGSYKTLLANQAQGIESLAGMGLNVPAIEGIGGSALYLLDQPFAQRYADYDFHTQLKPSATGLLYLDHLTHNVASGQMDHWASFYERLFNFKEVRYFDIKGKKTGLFSRAMTAPDGRVRIPINESADEHSQIAEYLKEYNGEGIQHIALYSDDIYASVETLRANGVDFMTVPDAYFELLPKRIPDHQEDLARLGANRILLDADPDKPTKKLLQIFTNTCIGPIFFEIIQRKGNEGFGEGNFQALFESIELDQQQRGVLS